jgi:hypothetical protein
MPGEPASQRRLDYLLKQSVDPSGGPGTGTDPVWKRSGGELFFRNGERMMAVSVSTVSAS